METVPLSRRVVEVIAVSGVPGHPSYRYGSGCIVAGRTVLTAAHVVTGARKVEVRDPNKVLYRATVDRRFVGDEDGPGPDLALVEIDDPAIDLPAMTLAAVDRDSVDAEPVERSSAVGYPWFAERPSPTAVRDTADVSGHVSVLSKLVSGRLSLHVRSAPQPLPPGTGALGDSEWSGMSGAPVVAAGCLLGVVTEHAPREGPSTITVTPLSALDDLRHEGRRTGVADPAEWWTRLGTSKGLAALRRLPRRRVRREPAYRATIAEVHRRHGQLSGRQRELDQIAAFATGPEGYRWLVGEPWAGKTALLAAAAAVPPPEVDVVAYFLSRLDADADSHQFLAAVVPQLVDLLDEEPTTADQREFRALWARACAAAAATGRHVLLVVDSLDEDLRPPGSPSVARLLPAEAGGHAHVLISSRPSLELREGLPTGHPLSREPARVALPPFDGSVELAVLAKQEIEDLKARDDNDLAIDVLAVLTAAAGPLAVEDLATLTAPSLPSTPAHTRAVRRLVTEAAHSLQPVGPGTSRRYHFAHPTLLKSAQADEDLCHPDYRERIHRWAETWRVADWPAGTEPASATPRYLLEAYPKTLANDAARPPDRHRLADLVGDIRWVDAAISRIGVDAVLASLRTAAGVAPTDASVAAMLRLVGFQAHHLRHARTVSHTGYATTALAWEALRLGLPEAVRHATDRLWKLPAPQLVPIWTTERDSLHLVSLLGRHDSEVLAVAVIADGRVASSDRDGVLRLWDPANPGDPGRELGRHRGGARALAVPAEGRVPAGAHDAGIVTGGEDGLVRLWDPAKSVDAGRVLGRHDRPVRSVAFISDGRVVSGGRDGALWLWDPANPRDRGRELGRHEDEVPALAAIADGHVVSGGRDATLRLWDSAAPGDPGRELGVHPGGVFALAVTTDGNVFSGGRDGAVRSWDPLDDPGCELGHPGDWVRALAVTPDGRVVSGGGDGKVWLWNPAKRGEPGRELGRHEHSVTSVALTADGRVVSGGRDKTVRMWNLATAGDPDREVGHNDGWVRSLAVSPRGLVVSGGGDGTVRLWDPAEPGATARELGRHDQRVTAVAVSAEGPVVSGGRDGTVRLWDPAAPADPGRVLGRHDGEVSAVAFTRNGHVVSGGHDGAVRMWNPGKAGDPGRELGRYYGAVLALAATADGQVVSGGDDTAVWLWDPAVPGSPGRQLGRHRRAVSAVAFTADGRVVSGGRDRAVRLWNPAVPNDHGRELGRHDGEVSALAFTTGGDVFSGGRDGTVRLWNPTAPNDPGRELARRDGQVRAIAATPDGQRLCVLTSAGITMFQVTAAPH